MSDVNRDRFFKVVTVLFFVVLAGLLAKWIYETGAITAVSRYESERNSSEYAAYAQERIERDCLEREPVAIAQCIREVVEATNEHKRSEDDLVAQGDMALWAFWMVIVSLAGVVATGIGVAYVALTLREARNTTRAALRGNVLTRKALRQAGDNAQRELRAYLVVEPDGVDQLIGMTEVIGKVRLRNVGRLPARKVTLVVRMARSQGVEMRASNRRSHFAFPHPPIYSDRVVQPDGEMRQGSEEYLAIPDLCVPHHNIYVYGIAVYEDGYGTPCFTRFCHRYSTDGRVRGINWKTLTTKSRTFIDTDKARYHTHGNDAN